MAVYASCTAANPRSGVQRPERLLPEIMNMIARLTLGGQSCDIIEGGFKEMWVTSCHLRRNELLSRIEEGRES